jgi:hypothetical protein
MQAGVSHLHGVRIPLHPGWVRGHLRLALRDFSTRRAIADLSV